MSVVQSINKFLKKIGKDEEYINITNVFDFLLGIESTNNIIWNYLNKGTHEEEGIIEFDELIVRDIYSHLTELDTHLKAS
jgi:hypothetical protein